MRRFATLGLSCFAALAVTACGGAPLASEQEDIETTDPALNGTVNFPDSTCNGYQSKITSAVSTAYANLNRADMTSCMRNAILSYYDSFAEEILARMRENLPTNVVCANLATNVNAQAQAGISNELITLDYGFMNANTAPRIASVILHEVAHNKGYVHPDVPNSSPSLPNLLAQEYSYTVNEQIEACSLSISASQSPALPNGPRLDSLPSETTLAPTGHLGGNAFALACSGGRIPKGIYGRAATLIDAFGLWCGPSGGSADVQTTSVGGTGGSPFSLRCNAGEVVVGLYGRAAQYNDAVGALCATEADVRAGLDTTHRLPPVDQDVPGGTGGNSYTRRCPAGMFVRGVHGRSGTFVDRLEVDCQRLDDVEPVAHTYLARVGGSGGNLDWMECAGRAALTGLTYQTTSSAVIRLGGSCSPITTTCSGANCTDSVGTAVYQLPASGGQNGQVGQQACAGGSVLVGMQFRADSNGVDAVGPICAPAAAWSVGGGSTTSFPPVGGPGTSASRTCNRGEFMTGWLIANGAFSDSNTDVDSVQPICRRFD